MKTLEQRIEELEAIKEIKMNQEQLLMWIKNKMDIEATILKYPTGADNRDWDLFSSVLADEMAVDFSSFANGPIATVTKEQYVAQVKALIPGFDATQHQLTNFVIEVDGDKADAVAYMQAEHFAKTHEGELVHTVGGYYTYKLDRINGEWKISSLKLTVNWTRGDMGAYAVATERAANM